jgi:hypothetical protein
LAFVSTACAAIACGGAPQDPDDALSFSPASAPVRTVAADRDVRMLLVDLAAENLCRHIAGEFVGLSGTGEERPSAAESKRDPSRARRGRLWVERCHAERKDGGELALELEGRGWRWVDRATEKLGARFSVSQYVRFDASVRARGTIDVSYARSKRIARLILSPTQPVRARVRPRGEVDARAEGVWAALLGGAASIAGSGPDEQASDKVASEGSRGLADRLASGYTVSFDLCTGQKYESIGALPEGELPHVPVAAAGRVFEENERVELMPGGVDLSGPFEQKDLPIAFDLDVESGAGVVARAVCAPEASRVAEAFLEGREPPDVEALAGAVVSAGIRETLRVERASCDVVLYTRPRGKTAKFAYLAWSEGSRARAYAPCPRP